MHFRGSAVLYLSAVCRYWVVGVPLAAWLAFKGGME
jgi:hypothetical protein